MDLDTVVCVCVKSKSLGNGLTHSCVNQYLSPLSKRKFLIRSFIMWCVWFFQHFSNWCWSWAFNWYFSSIVYIRNQKDVVLLVWLLQVRAWRRTRSCWLIRAISSFACLLFHALDASLSKSFLCLKPNRMLILASSLPRASASSVCLSKTGGWSFMIQRILKPLNQWFEKLFMSVHVRAISINLQHLKQVYY